MENPARKNRLPYIDDVRSLVIFLVVMVHASVTYSGLGSWYLVENMAESLGAAQMALFGLFNSFNQAWFMGIMFFFAGYFAQECLARKGSGTFVRERLLRLGLPLLGYVFVINPVMEYFIAYPEKFQTTGSFTDLYFGYYLPKGMFLSGTGPLWFVETLLLFSLALAAISGIKSRISFRSPARTADPSGRKVPSVSVLLLIILVTAVSAFAVRVFLPIGTDVMNLQLCFFPSYIVLFVLGVKGSSSLWFAVLTSGRSSSWFVAAFLAGIPLWCVTMIAGGALSGSTAFNGGLTWQSGAYSLWESFTAIAMSVGLTALFANRYAARKHPSSMKETPGEVSRFFSRNSFSVYVFHPVFLVSLTRLFSGWKILPLLKAPAIGVLAFTLTLAFAELIVRRIPGLRTYF